MSQICFQTRWTGCLPPSPQVPCHLAPYLGIWLSSQYSPYLKSLVSYAVEIILPNLIFHTLTRVCCKGRSVQKLSRNILALSLSLNVLSSNCRRRPWKIGLITSQSLSPLKRRVLGGTLHGLFLLPNIPNAWGGARGAMVTILIFPMERTRIFKSIIDAKCKWT